MKWLKIMPVIMLAFLFTFPGTALPDTGGEQVVKQQVKVLSYDIWQHTDGRWQDTDQCGKPDYYGWKGKQYSNTFKLPKSEWQGKCKLTRVEVTYPFSQEQFEDAGRPEDWEKFYRDYLTKTPNNYSVAKANENLAAGEVTVKFTFDLEPRSLDLKDPLVREQLGLPGKDFSNLAQGWRWYLPVHITWYGVVEELPDLYVKNLHPGTDEIKQGEKYRGTVTFGLKSDYPESVKAKLILIHNGYPVHPVHGKTLTFRPGEEKSYTFEYTGQNGDSRLEARIEPVGIDDVEWSNNEMWVEIPLIPDAPAPTGNLIFYAKSQDKSKSRPVNTAKWTDWVTAVLKPDRPDPPRGTLDWWEITSARLTYPKKNPKFTFGTPYGPVGTRTISMKTRGHTAEVTFQEDWAMDGAKIYSVIEKKLMAESPKRYTITAYYTIKYQYHYYVWRGSGEDRHRVKITKTKTVSGTAAGSLLVNGTGVDSRAM